MGWKRRRPTPAQQRRIADRYIARAPKRVRFGKRTVSLTLGQKRISYPFRYRKRVPAIGNWVHGKNPTILIDRDVKRKNRKALLVHEAVEQHLAENRGLSYRNAHRVAERMERKFVNRNGRTWQSYQSSVLRTKR